MSNDRNKNIAKLVRKAHGGGLKEGLALARALRREKQPVDVLLKLAQAKEEGLRIAAADASRARAEPELLAAMEVLAQDADLRVRRTLALAWAEAKDWPLSDTTGRILLQDDSEEVREPAAKAAAGRPAFVLGLIELLDDRRSWKTRQAAAESLVQAPAAQALVPLLLQLADDDDEDVSLVCARSVEKLLEAGGWPQDLQPPRVSTLETCVVRVTQLGERRFPVLLPWLSDQVEREVDPESLGQYGTDLSIEAEQGHLPRAFGLGSVCDRLLEVLTGEAPRAAVLLGDAGVGKTAVIQELTHRLLDGPGGAWRVLRLTPSDIMAGTLYMGQWETKVRSIIKLAQRPRRVLLYVPNLDGLQDAGRNSRSNNSVLTMLVPHIESGAIAIIGESSSEAFRAGIGREPSLRKLFRSVDCSGATPKEARNIADAVCRDAAIEVADGVLDRLQEMAGFFLAGTSEPGRTVGLLRRVLEERGEEGAPLSEADVLTTLAKVTGVPRVVLDDEQPLELDAVQAFFDARVMGQPEARDAVLDLITLIKAGLTDPRKPYGVLFFVGPTGVGKTEMARTLAEMLFGDPARLHRFDMSEYATYEAFERLIGTQARPGLLTEVVREDPFAVILLDEIEKAHPTVYDLCLQVFDAGRLTDGQGRTADFRRAILILTSNVGSAIPTEASIGFGGGLPPPPDPEHIERALRQTFRPEFLGRLDRIVYFRPLGLETAEQIARREIAAVLERSGITRRELVIDVDPDVLSFLLREGYSPALGARPLKRTVERHVLLPVARVIARGAAARGSILRLRTQARDIAVEIVPQEATGDSDAGRPHTPSRPLAVLSERVAALSAQLLRMSPPAQEVATRRSMLLEQSRAPGFWDDRRRALDLLDEVHRWEGILERHARLELRIRDTADQVAAVKSKQRPPGELSRRVEELERATGLLEYLLTCSDPRDLGDTLVTVTLLKSQGNPLHGPEKLAGMYVGFAQRHGLEVEVLSDRLGGEAGQDSLVLQITGVGAHGLLRDEQGLHQLARTGEAGKPQRSLVRVDVLPTGTDVPVLRRDEVRVSTKVLKRVRGRLLDRPSLEMTLVHLPSMQSLTAWTLGPKREAVERLLPLLGARVATAGDTSDPARVQIVRRYRLGASALVRDKRTGRSTGRLQEVLAGDLDRFLVFGEQDGVALPGSRP